MATMDEATASRIAGEQRAAHAVPPLYAPRGAEQRFIELTQPSGDGGTLVRDALVWVVRFQGGIAWVELAVEQSSGLVVRMERSRAHGG